MAYKHELNFVKLDRNHYHRDYYSGNTELNSDILLWLKENKLREKEHGSFAIDCYYLDIRSKEIGFHPKNISMISLFKLKFA
jgi:hypothetical protein